MTVMLCTRFAMALHLDWHMLLSLSLVFYLGGIIVGLTLRILCDQVTFDRIAIATYTAVNDLAATLVSHIF